MKPGTEPENGYETLIRTELNGQSERAVALLRAYGTSLEFNVATAILFAHEHGSLRETLDVLEKHLEEMHHANANGAGTARTEDMFRKLFSAYRR